MVIHDRRTVSYCHAPVRYGPCNTQPRSQNSSAANSSLSLSLSLAVSLCLTPVFFSSSRSLLFASIAVVFFLPIPCFCLPPFHSFLPVHTSTSPSNSPLLLSCSRLRKEGPWVVVVVAAPHICTLSGEGVGTTNAWLSSSPLHSLIWQFRCRRRRGLLLADSLRSASEIWILETLRLHLESQRRQKICRWPTVRVLLSVIVGNCLVSEVSWMGLM